MGDIKFLHLQKLDAPEKTSHSSIDVGLIKDIFMIHMIYRCAWEQNIENNLIFSVSQ